MRMTDGNAGHPCRVIPFERPAKQEDHVTISNIAAVIAVTVLHYKDESPEKRLLEIIESSGEAEVFDIADALEDFNEVGQTGALKHQALNDNEPVTLV